MSSNIKAVIFDKDGTLLDTERLYHTAWKLAAKELGVPDIETTSRDCTGCAWPTIEIYWNKKYIDTGLSSVTCQVFRDTRQKYFDKMIEEEGIPLKKDTFMILDYLKERGYKLGLATSATQEEADTQLDATGIRKYFDTVVTSAMVTKGKPDPEIYLLAAKNLGIEPENCIGVEDAFNGVRSIHAAGMKPIMIPDVLQPTEEIRSLLWAECETLADMIPLLEM